MSEKEVDESELLIFLGAIKNEDVGELERLVELNTEKFKQYQAICLTDAIIRKSSEKVLDVLISHTHPNKFNDMLLKISSSRKNKVAFRKLMGMIERGELKMDVLNEIASKGDKEMIGLAVGKIKDPYFKDGQLIRDALLNNKKEIIELLYEGGMKYRDIMKKFIEKYQVKNEASDYYLKRYAIDEFKKMAAEQMKPLNKNSKKF